MMDATNFESTGVEVMEWRALLQIPILTSFSHSHVSHSTHIRKPHSTPISPTLPPHPPQDFHSPARLAPLAISCAPFSTPFPTSATPFPISFPTPPVTLLTVSPRPRPRAPTTPPLGMLGKYLDVMKVRRRRDKGGDW